ncbi:MAG: hypothetical protein QM831_40520 [Kofleriaceae bacterium]
MLLRIAALVVLAGCPSTPPDACTPPQQGSGLGDTNGADAELVAVDASGNLVTLHDGDPVPLLGAPQGGHILLVGARIHEADECSLDATGALRDTGTQRVLGLDSRAMYMEPTGDGFSQPQNSLAAMPNVAVCPTSATTAAVNGQPYQLELTASAMGTTIVDLKVMVTPACAADDSYCAQDCGPQGSF